MMMAIGIFNGQTPPCVRKLQSENKDCSYL